MATAAELMVAMVALGAADGMNIDELCYYYGQVTGVPCPSPEDFGAGSRNVAYSVASFAGLAASGFDGAGTSPGQQTAPPNNTVPSTGATPGGQVTISQQGGGLFGGGNLMTFIIIGLILWLLFED